MNCDSSSYNEEKRQRHLWPCLRRLLLAAMNRPYFWYIGAPYPHMPASAPAFYA